jgi:hypothetical protein
MSVAVANCQKQSADPCHLYAVNDAVVWKDGATQTADADSPSKNDSKPALASR